MRLFKLGCFTILSVVTFWGCSLFGSSDDSSNGGGNNSGTEYSLTTSANPSSGGSVSPASGSFEEGSQVTVEATPSGGWNFTNWTGDQQSSQTILTFTINQDTDLTANFEGKTSEYTLGMVATNTQDTVDLEFGQTQGATEGYDSSMDYEAPPSPPSGALNAYFEINDLDLIKDHRSNEAREVQWTLHYQVDDGETLKLKWDITNNTQSDGNLELTDESGSFSVDMFNESSHSVSGSTSGKLLINYGY